MYSSINQFLCIEVYDLWRIRKTCFEMLEDRGYTVVAEDSSFYPQKGEGYEMFQDWVLDKLKDRKEDNIGEAKQLALLKRNIASKKKQYRKALTDGDLTQEEYDAKIVKVTSQYNKEAKQYNRTFEKLLTIRAVRDKRKLLVLFLKEEKLTKKSLDDCIDYRSQCQVHDLMLISKHGHTSAIEKYVTDFKERTVRSWKFSELLFNISHSIYVPTHRGLTPSEKTKFLKKYCLTADQIPSLKRTDPMTKYHHFYPKQVIEIMRPSETAGKIKAFRIVE